MKFIYSSCFVLDLFFEQIHGVSSVRLDFFFFFPKRGLTHSFLMWIEDGHLEPV